MAISGIQGTLCVGHAVLDLSAKQTVLAGDNLPCRHQQDGAIFRFTLKRA